jgi:hypothetical protein
MAYGLLGSIIPQIKQNTVVFTAPVNTLAYGKVSISSKNPSPSRIRLGIASLNQNDPVRYLEYNKTINYGEAFETNTIYLGNGEKLVVRSDNSDVNFVFYGETFDESLQPVKSGLVGIITSTNNQKQVLYQVPSNAQGLLSISVCNLGPQVCKARIGISSVTFPVGSGTSQYLEYNIEINPNQTYTRTDLKLQENQRLTCSSDGSSTANFVCYGRLIYDINKLVVDGDTILQGNLGIGTTANGYKLRVGGNTFIDGPINVSGITTLSNYVDILNNLNVVGVSTLGGYVDINASVDILNNLNVTGVSTFTGVIDVNGGAYIDNIQIGITDNNEIDTTSGNLTIDSAGGTTTIDDKLVVTGITTFSSTTTFISTTTFEQFIFGQISMSLLSS